MNTPPSNPSSENNNLPERPRISPFWWVILIALFIWNIWTLRPQVQQEINVPYTAFINQVKAGNVKDVQIDGTQISGDFISGLPASDLIPPDQLATPLPTPQSASGPQDSSKPELFTAFTTTFPDAVGDPNLISLLEANNVVLNVKTPSNPLILDLLINGLPFILLIAAMAWMGRQTLKSQSGIFNFGRSKARQYGQERPDVTFEDVAGAEEAKEELSEVPTNHLDLESINALNIALQRYPGTLLLVTHDYDVVDEVASRIWAFHDGRIEDFKGTYEQYLAQAAQLV